MESVHLTAACFAFLVAVDEEVSGALRTHGQQAALQRCWEHSETQQEGPQGRTPHDRLNPKDLSNTQSVGLTHSVHNTAQYRSYMFVMLCEKSRWGRFGR